VSRHHCEADLEELIGSFSDLARLRRLHGAVRACVPDGPPCLKTFFPELLSGARSLAVLSGSFNPLTAAHLAVADAAEKGRLGPILFLLSTFTIDKERPQGALLEDRLLMLELHARRNAPRSVGLTNRGLYVEQAELIRSGLPSLVDLTFLVGFDKIVQIFDPRYYDERDAALRALFDLASFAVAPRAGAGPAELAELLARPQNRPFAGRVRPLELARAYAEVSASAIRAALASGQTLAPGLPPESAVFIAATGCYEPNGRYGERVKLIAGL
jgi:nicotinamide-nucleotide adenylyltransferase